MQYYSLFNADHYAWQASLETPWYFSCWRLFLWRWLPGREVPNHPAPVEKTGQTSTYAIGDDGDLEKGVLWPVPRFIDNLDGTITDNLTGLIWLKNANCFGPKTWDEALVDCSGLASGSCGLTDSSNAGDWRLPHVKELQSLIDFSNYPALPSGHPFNQVQNDVYWSSSTGHIFTEAAWQGSLAWGIFDRRDKTYSDYVWPVRGGH